MELSLSAGELKQYVQRQVNYLFPDGKEHFKGKDIDTAIGLALERCELCFCGTNRNRGKDGGVRFYHLNADQYATFLYFFANSLYKLSENLPACDKLLQLNRVLHQLFLSYKCNMPDVFYLVHPIGTIIGNAIYDNYLLIFQGVTINTNSDTPPKIGKSVYLSSGVSIIGNTTIGNRVVIGAGVTLNSTNVPDDSIVYNDKNSGHLVIKEHDNTRFFSRYMTVEEEIIR